MGKSDGTLQNHRFPDSTWKIPPEKRRSVAFFKNGTNALDTTLALKHTMMGWDATVVARFEKFSSLYLAPFD